MKRGVPTLEMPQTVCEQGKQLTPEQARLLKLLGERMVDFRVVLRAWWSADTSELTEVDGAISPVDGAGEDEDEDEDDDVEDIAE
jgi:mRNA turnover protein 4